MNVIFKPFENIEEIKLRGEHIKKGRVVPTRILKSLKRGYQHTVKAGSNWWAVPTRMGYLVFVENNDGTLESVIHFPKLDGDYKASPYTKGGGTHWQGNAGITDDDLLRIFNRRYLSMNTSGAN